MESKPLAGARSYQMADASARERFAELLQQHRGIVASVASTFA
jgi:hypothetical protein